MATVLNQEDEENLSFLDAYDPKLKQPTTQGTEEDLSFLDVYDPNLKQEEDEEDLSFLDAYGPKPATRRPLISPTAPTLESLGIATIEEPQPEESFLRPLADPLLNIGAGINDVVKGFTDAFGADNAVSQNLAKNSEWYRSLLSAGAKQDQEEIGRIMQEAEGQGVLAEVGAGLKALSVAPIDLVSQGIGSLIPFIATAGIGKAVGLSKAGIAVLQGVQGGVVGGGIVKGEIYSAVKEQLINSGVDEAKAEKAAQEAQAYNGKNLDQIFLGVGLGVAASTTGADSAIRSLIARKVGKEAAEQVSEQAIQEVLRTGFVRGAVKDGIVEAATEGLQGGQERLAANIAVGREGFDVEPMRGVFSQATLEGAIGGVLGGGAGGISAKVEQMDARQKVALRDAAKAAEEAKQSNAPASAAAVEEQINQTIEETPDEKVARLQREAQEAAGDIELEEEGAGLPPERIKSARWFESAARNRLKELQDKDDAGVEDFTTQERDEFEFLKANPTPEQIAERYGYGVAAAVEPTAVTTTTPAVTEPAPPTLTPPPAVTEPIVDLAAQKAELDAEAKRLGADNISSFNSMYVTRDNLTDEQRGLLNRFAEYNKQVQDASWREAAKLDDSDFARWEKSKLITKAVSDQDLTDLGKLHLALKERGDTEKAESVLKNISGSKRNENETIESWREGTGETLTQEEIDKINRDNQEWNDSVDSVLEVVGRISPPTAPTPTAPAAVEPTPVTPPVTPEAPTTEQRAGAFNEFIREELKRQVDEQRGQQVLDAMEQAGESPRAVVEDFYRNIYDNLTPDVRARFDKYVERLGWSVPATMDASPKSIGMEGAIDLGNDVQALEGIERGFVALVRTANNLYARRPATEVTPPPELAAPTIPQLEPLRRVARAEQTEEDVAGLVDGGLVELYKGQPVITQAGLEALPEAERPRLTPEARKIQIDTRTSEAAAEAISKNLRIGVDQVPVDVRMPAGWTLVGDVYVPPTRMEKIAGFDVLEDYEVQQTADVFQSLYGQRPRVDIEKIVADARAARAKKPVTKPIEALRPKNFLNISLRDALRKASRMNFLRERDQQFADIAAILAEAPIPALKDEDIVSLASRGRRGRAVRFWGGDIGMASTKGMSIGTLLHEGGHSLTADQLRQYGPQIKGSRPINGKEYIDQLKSLSQDQNVPEPIRRMFSLYVSTIDQLGLMDVYAAPRGLAGTPNPDTSKRRALEMQREGKISEEFTGSDFYGLANIYEFVSQTFNSKSFQDKLKNLKSPINTNKTLWQEFVTAIREILGFPSDSMAAAVIEAAVDISMTTPSERMAQFLNSQDYLDSFKDGLELKNYLEANKTKDLIEAKDVFRKKFNREPHPYSGQHARFFSKENIESEIQKYQNRIDSYRQQLPPSEPEPREGLAEEGEPEAISKNLRIGVDQVPVDVRMPEGWTLEGDIYVPPQAPAPTPEVREARREPAITPQQDRDYLDAVERGDSGTDNLSVLLRASKAEDRPSVYQQWAERNPKAAATLQKAVDEAAKKAGYTIKVYHGSSKLIKFTEFKIGDIGFHFGDIGAAEDRAEQRWGDEAIVKPFYLIEGNFAKVRDVGDFGDSAAVAEELLRTGYISQQEYNSVGSISGVGESRNIEQLKQLRQILVDKGYDGILYTNRYEGFKGSLETSYAIFNSSFVKSADPVTRDDQGNIIPLSQRFQPEQADIRYARIEPSEIKQQYTPKTDEEQKAFDKASSNKVLARNPQLAVAAVRMKNGEITAGEYADLVDVLDPFVVKGAEPVPTNEKIYQYMSQTAGGKPTSEQGKKKLAKIGAFKEDGTQRIPNGKLVEFRIDIPTYNKSTESGDTVYSITGHEPVSEAATNVGETIAHLGIAKITNPQFITRTISGKGDAIQIAMGAGKFPLATVKGNYEAITELPADINDPNVWTETGYNPVRSSELVDVRSKKALVGGTEAIMVGSRVFVKNAQLEARPTGITMGERYARRVQMGRAGMETSAVEARLQELGFPTGGIIRVVNQPDADFEGRTIILDGKVTGIELNASALKDNAAIDRVLNHEFAESANADGALNRLVERLTPKEKKEINDTITRLRYSERAITAEEAARAVELLAEGWRGRRWFERAVARIEAWANKLGYKLTRRAAEYIAARNVSEINDSFKQAYNKFINVQGEERESRRDYQADSDSYKINDLSKIRKLLNISNIENGIVKFLSRDLLDAKWSKIPVANDATTHGHCWVAAEAAYHILGGKGKDWEHRTLNNKGWPEGLDAGETHHFIQNKKTGEIIDPTRSQFGNVSIPYGNSIFGGAFMGKTAENPSIRAKALLHRIATGELKAEIRESRREDIRYNPLGYDITTVVEDIKAGRTDGPLRAVNNVIKQSKELRDRIQREAARRQEPRARGKSAILDRLSRERAAGRISEETAQALTDFVNRIREDAIGDTALSIRKGGVSNFNFGETLVSFFLNQDQPATGARVGIHEFFHGLSRFLPDAEVEQMRQDYTKNLAEYLKKNPWFLAFVGRYSLTPEQFEAYKLFNPKEAETKLQPVRDRQGNITKYQIKYDADNYRYIMLDEWIAEKMTDLVRKKQAVPDTFLGKIAKVIRDFLDLVKARLGKDAYESFYQTITDPKQKLNLYRMSSVAEPFQIYEPTNFNYAEDVLSQIRYMAAGVEEGGGGGIPTFSDGSPEASTLSTMASSMAKVDAASEAKSNPENKPTYKISEIASVWMDQGGDERALQDAITENTNLSPVNAAKVAKAIARQYDKQQQIAEAVLETEAGVTLEGLPEGMEIPKDVDPKNKRTVLQRVIDATTGVRVKPVILQVPEKTALKEQIRFKARETREAKKAQQETADAVVEAIKALELRGPMRAKQAQALAKRAAKVLWTSEKSMENFIAYAERVMANTNYDADLREAKAAQKRAKQLSKRDSIAAPQRETLEAIGNIGINLLNDPREFADVVNHYLRSFKPVVSEAYVVVPDAEMKSYLSMAEDEVVSAKAEFDVEDNEKLAEKYGVSVKDLQRFLDAEDIMDALEGYAKREVIEGILNEKSANVREALKGVDTTILRADQRKLIDAMKVIDVKSLDSAEKQAYVRIGNNIIFNNNQTNGAEFFVATAKGQQAARDLAKNTEAMTKNKAWANILPSLGSRKAKKLLKSWASELQSIADTFRNAFGKEAMTVFYEAMGMVDLDLGFTQAARTLEEIQEKMAKFYDKLGKKHKGAATNQDGILSEGIVGYLIQNVPAKGEADSLAQRRGLMQQGITNLRKSGDEDKIQMADRIQQLMQRLDGDTVDQMLSNLKREYPANYESLMWLKDELFPQYKDFLKFSDENFNDQANNYNTPNYLPIVYSNASPVLDLLQGKKKYYDNLSSSPKQSSYTIKRSDYTQLPMGSDGRTPKEISLNLRKNAYNSLSDQITRAYTNPARQRISSFLKTPEAEEALGGKANLDFFADRIERLMGSRERRGSFNEGFFGKAVDVLANLVRDVGTRIALAGSYQLIRQPADQVTVAVGATGRADLMAEHLAPRSIQTARPVLDLFSIGRRGDASSGYKYINQMEGAQSRLERYYTEGNWVKAKEAAKRFSDKFMTPLKVSDFTVAAATWMTFYRAHLAKNGIKFTTWEDAANLIKSDDVGHRRAAAYAENMTDIYQGSSDPTKMAVFAQKGKTGTENLLKSILVPFNSFGIQFRARVSSDITEIFTKSGDWKGKAIAVKDLSATIGGTVMFGLAKRFVLPAITYGGIKILYGIFGVDVEEPDEEKQKEEFDQKWRQLQGDIISTMAVGGFGQMIEGHTIDGMNYIKYMIDTVNESESVLDDDGEIMSFNKYSKERAPFYRYRSFDNAPSLGMLDIGMDQARKAILNTKMVLTPEEMERFTPEEQRFLLVGLISDWLYLGGFNDADFARMWDKGRRDMINARKEEEKELQRIRSGR